MENKIIIGMRLSKPLSIISCLVLGLLMVGCQQQSKNLIQRPNVVFILVDDLGLVDLGITGSKYYETPNIDKLAKEGMVFTQGYAASRVCSPSRASIMTGKFTARHGITDWIGAASGAAWRSHNRHDKLLPADYVHSLPAKDVTIAETMKKEGYKTFFAGKWHLGSEGSYPEDHGFDINKGGWEKGSPMGGYFSPWDNPTLPNKVAGENLTMRLGNETADFIKQHKDSTFFAFLSFYAVHGPIQTTQEKWGKYRDKAEVLGVAEKGYKMERVLPIRQEQDNPIYAGLVESMDDAVGVVLQALKDSGLEENTIVIFTSDNGGVASGDSFSTSNRPLRGGKGYQWEGGIREPYFIKVPWLKNGGSESDFPVVGTDFYPTILDLANIDALTEQHIDGISLKPILEGKKMDVVRPLFWHYPHYGNQGGNPSSIIREENWKLIHYWEDGSEELYDLATDAGEQSNVITQYPEIAKKLSKKLHEWLKEVGANMPSKDPEYNAEMSQKRHNRIVNESWPALEAERLKFLSKDFVPNEDWWGSKVTQD
ncbi:sulfatase [Arenibacter echinorum]|uniref:Arylsulfatase A-like enzyme n=1 Tax=Arenibacter echinorum TaxID=440515 RepID=A0A327R900_9FLAO|nr:sulfatase [Arenibacter echinorum]RAJ10397.1 arylsulfatase A-like enzyme [Arenibacter echinorum]